jgi:hypothetical protein
MLLIYGHEQAQQGLTTEQEAAVISAWYQYTTDLQQAGQWLGGAALQPTATATTVRGIEGRTLVVDGPFAETKEQLGGYYLIEATDLDDAITWARRMPHVPLGGAVEVRPVEEFDSPPSDSTATGA